MSLSVRDTNGNLIDASSYLFSGIIPGSGVYSKTIRLYNNYDGDPNVAHVRNVKVFLSPVSGSVDIPIGFGDPNLDVRTHSLYNNLASGICIFSSKIGADPSGTLQNLVFGVSGSNYDEISASGANNYNEYRIDMEIKSGTVLNTTSGTIYFHVEYRTYLP